MIKILKHSAFIFFSLTFFSYAEIVEKVLVKGNSRISSETINVYGEIEINKDYTSFEINKILKNLYDTEFFEDIKISLDNKVLNIEVKEYASINSIKLVGEKSSSIAEKILEKLQLQEKSSFIESKLVDDINTIKKMYASIGFNFATVESKIQNFDQNRINLSYVLDKGKKTKIAKINFIGDKKIKSKRLRDVIASEEDRFWKFLSRNTSLSSSNIELDKRLLVNYYKSLGYYDVRVLSNNAEISQKEYTNLTYTINAGVRFRVKKISTNVSDVLDKKTFKPLVDSYAKIIGKYYSPFKVTKLLDEVEALIEENDLQFVEHSVNEILEGDFLEIQINIYEGKKLLVEQVNILGNTITDESVIRGELLLDEGDPFSTIKLDRSVAKLKSRNIFNEVKTEIVEGENKDNKIINITIEEKPTGEISAGAGVGTTGGSFAFNITESNWLGRGISLSTNVDVSAESFEGGIDVGNPNYDNTGNALNYFVKNTKNDKSDSGYKNNIYSAGVGVGFEQYKDIYLSPKLVFSYDDLTVEDTASKSMKKQKGTFTDLSFDYGISLDKRDRVFAPTAGYSSRFFQSFPIITDSAYIKNEYGLSSYRALSKDMIGSFKLNMSAINGLNDKDVRLSKRLYMSSNRLRGFKNGGVGPKDGLDYVGGNYSYTSNFELSLPNLLPESTKTDISTFLDFGNLWGVDYDDDIANSSKIRSSIGSAVSWTSPLGPMVFIFSQNISKESTDATEAFSFRLGTTF